MSPATLARAFDRVGVDFEQWKALTAVAIKLDFLDARASAGSRSNMASPTGQIILYLLFGLSVAALVWVVPDLLVVGAAGTAFIMVTIAMIVLVDHNSIVSPLDYAILAHQPIASRTYFAARLANAVLYTGAITALVVAAPVASLFLRHGAAVAGAGVLAFFGASIATTLAILIGYASVLGLAGPERLQRMLSYVQLAMSFAVMGGYMAGMRQLASLGESLAVGRGAASMHWVLLLMPPAWFGAYLELAAGRSTPQVLLAASASVALVAVLASALGSRLTLDYSHRLAETMATAERGKPGARRTRGSSWLFASGESRAVALLVRSQFQSDVKFSLAILAVVPLTILYGWFGATDGSIRDPFLPLSAGHSPGFPMITFAIVMFPLTLTAQLAASDAFRASWIFFASPADRMRIIRSAKDVVTVVFLVPYLALVAAIIMYVTGSVVHVAIHLVLIGLLSHFALQVLTFLHPALPFSRPPAKGQDPARFFGFMILSMMVAAILQFSSPALYRSVTATAGVFALVIAASVQLDRLTKQRVARDAAGLEFGG